MAAGLVAAAARAAAREDVETVRIPIDHVLVLMRETLFGLPALTRRDAAANPMLEFFDFHHPSFATPPALSAAPLDPRKAARRAGLAG